MIHIGFTGTQLGMTRAQGESVWGLLRISAEFIGHHGDCVGSDKTFDDLCRVSPLCLGMEIHPPIIDAKRAFCTTDLRDFVHPAKDYLVRNHDIVDVANVMIATPAEYGMQLRSGTWSTIRYARSVDKPLAIVYLSGAVVFEGPAWP